LFAKAAKERGGQVWLPEVQLGAGSGAQNGERGRGTRAQVWPGPLRAPQLEGESGSAWFGIHGCSNPGVPFLVGDLSLAGLQIGGKAPRCGGSALESQRHDGQADQGDTNDEDPEQDLGPLVMGEPEPEVPTTNHIHSAEEAGIITRTTGRVVQAF